MIKRVQELLERFKPAQIPTARRVFVNRNLRLSRIEMVGFDMDYTLAEYHTALEELQVQMTLERLVGNLGYPAAALELTYDPNFAIRGLVLDKKLGNLVKMDTHRHISRAFHGTQSLAKQRRRRAYRSTRIRMREDRFALVDTLFEVPETWLYAQMVDLVERAEGGGRRRRLKAERYRQIFADIRKTIDTIHADQSLKAIITADIGRYVRRDPDLPTALHRLREAGKRLFVMTNSYGWYTSQVMSYMLDGARDDYPSWRDYFDIVIVGSKKPDFFIQGLPFCRLGDDFEPTDAPVQSFERGALYQHGNLADFERLANCSGDRILYVGDHLYGDILRSKRSSGWRTMMIIPELERELSVTEAQRADFEHRTELETTRSQLDFELQQKQQLIRSLSEFVSGRAGEFDTQERLTFKAALEVARADCDALRQGLNQCLHEIWALNNRLAKAFNPHWGLLFKARAEHSLFGGQVEAYACLYTSRVSNLASYSPYQYFRAPRDHMPHELTLSQLHADPELANGHPEADDSTL